MNAAKWKQAPGRKTQRSPDWARGLVRYERGTRHQGPHGAHTWGLARPSWTGARAGAHAERLRDREHRRPEREAARGYSPAARGSPGGNRRKAKVGRTSGGIKTAIMRATAPSVRVAGAAASLVGQTPKRDPSRRREDEVDGDGREVVGHEKSTSKSIPEEGRLIQGHQRRENHAETKRDVGGQGLRPGLQHCIAAANATNL